MYNARERNTDFEMQYPMIEYKENLKDLFVEADIISLHIPLKHSTEKLINRDLLISMKNLIQILSEIPAFFSIPQTCSK